jgi:hypothetical protein
LLAGAARPQRSGRSARRSGHASAWKASPPAQEASQESQVDGERGVEQGQGAAAAFPPSLGLR